MRKRLIVLIGTALGVLLMVASAPGQWSTGETGSYGYDQSTLFQSPSGSFDQSQPPVYYPYWHNYLDSMQREGGYYSITGNYAGSAPVTSYYPASPSSEATSPQAAASQSNMYYNPSDYYAAQGSAPAYGAAPVQPPGYQAYQAPMPMPQSFGAAQSQQSTPSKKKRRLSAKQQAAEQAQQQAYYQQAPQYQQQPYGQQTQYQQPGYYQQSPYQSQDAYAQQQAYQQQGYQQQAYQQQAGAYPAGQYAGYQQQPQVGTEPQSALNQDPVVRDAQQKAYERAAARQRAAEMAAQQQAAVQELQQAQQMLETAQVRFREQENRQKQLQEEYHKKAVAEAYEGLRAAQQRYYDLMGVSGESGGRQAGQGYPVQAGAQQPMQYPQQMPAQAQPQQYAQTAPTAPYAGPQPQYQYRTGQPAAGIPAGQPQPLTPSPTPPGRATPLVVQPQQQQEESGGLWGTLKEIFFPPSNVVPSPRPFQDRNKGSVEGL